MNGQPITAIPIPERRIIKRKANLFTLLACLAGCAGIVYWLAADADRWFWLLTSAALVLMTVAALAWRFERPRITLLIGGTSANWKQKIE